MRPRVLLFLLAPTLAVLPAGAAFAAPANDDLAGATPVVVLPFDDSIDVGSATLEPGEADLLTCAPLQSTVWYAVTLDSSTAVTVDTAGSTYDTVLNVFRGTSFGDLDLVDCNDDVDELTNLQARVSFVATPGETFLVQVGEVAAEELTSAGKQLEISFTKAKIITEHRSFEGSEAFAIWFADNAQTTVAVLDGQRKAGSGKPFRVRTLFVDHASVEVDPATGASWLTFLSGTPPLEPSQSGIGDDLRHAFVDAALTLQGARCLLPELEQCEWLTADVTVSVTWTGHDKILTSFDIFRIIEDDFRFVLRAQGTMREATADGSIAGAVDLIAGPTEIAHIARTSHSDILWIRLG